MSSFLENGFHTVVVLSGILSRKQRSTSLAWVELNELWRAFHRSSSSIYKHSLHWIVSTIGSLHFLTQFISFYGLYLLFAISLILLSKKEHLDFLTMFLKSFQFSRLHIWQYLSSEQWQSSFYQTLECLVILTVFEYSNHIFSILEARYWTTSSSNLVSWMDVVFMFLMTWMRSSINCFSSSLSLTSDYCLLGILLSWMGISTVIGAWSDKNLHSRCIWWWLNSEEERQRNTRSKTKLVLWSLSKNLVRRFSEGLEIAKENKSAISKRVSLWTEWNGKFVSYRLSLMLKSPVIMMTLWMLVLISLRYFKADWEESE